MGTGKIKGVVYADGKPLAGAMVQLYRNQDSDPGGDGDDGVFSRVETVDADRQGRYEFSGIGLAKDPKHGLEIYQYRVLVTDRTGRAVKTVRVVKPKKGRTTTRDVNLPVGAIVKGKVTRADSARGAGRNDGRHPG